MLIGLGNRSAIRFVLRDAIRSGDRSADWDALRVKTRGWS